MNTTPKAVTVPLMLQPEPTVYGDNAAVGTNAEGSSVPRLGLDTGLSMHSVRNAFDFSTIDPLDLQRPLPEAWCSTPQTSLQPEVLHSDFLSDSAMAGTCGSAPSDGALGLGRSLAMSGRDPPGPLVASAQVEARSFPCVFIQHSSGHLISPQHGRGHLKFLDSGAEYQRWLELVNLRGPSSEAALISNGGGDSQPNTTQFSSAYPGPPTPMSATSISLPAYPSSPRPHQDPVHFPRSSYSGPSDSRCAPAATSIPATPYYQDAFSSLGHPPPPIAHTANLDPSRATVDSHAFYQCGALSADNRVPILSDPLAQLPGDNTTPPASIPQLISPNRDTAPGYQAHDDPPPEAAAQMYWQVGDNGRGRS